MEKYNYEGKEGSFMATNTVRKGKWYIARISLSRFSRFATNEKDSEPEIRPSPQAGATFSNVPSAPSTRTRAPFGSSGPSTRQIESPIFTLPRPFTIGSTRL